MPNYRIAEFRKVPAPNNVDNYKWFYYVISNEVNCITGYREGNKKEVEQYLRETVSRLNNKYNMPAHSYQRPACKVSEPSPAY
jgi:archaellum component FlaC